MKTKVMEKVSFHRFFPNNQNFVVASGEARSPSDFWLSLDFGDGIEKTSFSFGDWNNKDSIEMLKSMRRAVQEALEFYERALSLPPMMSSATKDYDTFFKFPEKKEEKKKPAAKKATAAAKPKATTKAKAKS